MDTLTLLLAIIGCANWGLVGLFQFDLVAWLFGGQGSLLSRIIYTLVGLAGLWCISFLFRKDSLFCCFHFLLSYPYPVRSVMSILTFVLLRYTCRNSPAMTK